MKEVKKHHKNELKKKQILEGLKTANELFTETNERLHNALKKNNFQGAELAQEMLAVTGRSIDLETSLELQIVVLPVAGSECTAFTDIKRRLLATGWSVKTHRTRIQGNQDTSLSEQEQDVIKQVIMRAEALEVNEQERV
ncbi:unnamed protein product, partial [Timema podura]|nr:unnamed protein product [Timema podura]